MMKDRQDPFSGMSLEELWQLFPVFLTEHRPVWAQWYQEERERLFGILPMEDICEISHVGSTSIPSNLRGVTAFATTAPLPLGKAPCCVISEASPEMPVIVTGLSVSIPLCTQLL